MRRMKNLLKKGTSLMLVFAMLMGLCSTAFAVENNDDNTINYVSLGDSMTNGYCFTGYEQGNGDKAKLDFANGKGSYGEDAYPNLFAEWLAETSGKVVNHTKLAPSAMRAEDLLYLLGGRGRWTLQPGMGKQKLG